MTQGKNVRRFVRVQPKKLRPLADLVRTKSVDLALAQLKSLPGRNAASEVSKSSLSARSAALEAGARAEDLKISTIMVDEGPMIKRWRVRERGRSTKIQKKMSHITTIVSTKTTKKAPKVKKQVDKSAKTVDNDQSKLAAKTVVTKGKTE